jgi:hypothetical protein
VVFRLRFRKEKTNQTGKMMAAYQQVLTSMTKQTISAAVSFVEAGDTLVILSEPMDLMKRRASSWRRQWRYRVGSTRSLVTVAANGAAAGRRAPRPT